MEDGSKASQNYFSQALDQREHKKKARRRVERDPKPLIRFSFSTNGGATICISVLFEAIFIIIIIVRNYQSSKSLNISSVPLTSSIAREPRTSLHL